MNSDAEKMEQQEINLPYEQPSLKKYGSMKEFTLGSGGSGSTFDLSPRNPNDPDSPSDTNPTGSIDDREIT